MNRVKIYRILLLLVIILNPPISLSRSAITINDAMVTEPPPGVEMTAGYFKIRNNRGKPVSLVKVTSPDFGSIELHRSIITDNIARMVRQNSVTVPSNSSLAFQPGSYHLMMFRPKKKLSIGDTVSMTFYFSDSTRLDVKAAVMKPGTGHDDHIHQHH